MIHGGMYADPTIREDTLTDAACYLCRTVPPPKRFYQIYHDAMPKIICTACMARLVTDGHMTQTRHFYVPKSGGDYVPKITMRKEDEPPRPELVCYLCKMPLDDRAPCCNVKLKSGNQVACMDCKPKAKEQERAERAAK